MRYDIVRISKLSNRYDAWRVLWSYYLFENGDVMTMRDDQTYINVTGDCVRCAGDVFEDGQWYRPIEAKRAVDGLRASIEENWQRHVAKVIRDMWETMIDEASPGDET
ncbi:MAG: hypothetical protein EB015_15360 [Methylocystaceae bacterium]|nr:hypothetical protein [Methylocystaceae bacterium]